MRGYREFWLVIVALAVLAALFFFYLKPPKLSEPTHRGTGPATSASSDSSGAQVGAGEGETATPGGPAPAAAPAPGNPAPASAPPGASQSTSARPAGTAPAPKFRAIDLQGEYLTHSGYARSLYIYTKDDFDRMSGKDRPVRLHRYSMSGELLLTSELGYFVDLAELPGGKIFVGGTMKAWLLDGSGKLLHEEDFGEGADIFAEIAVAPDGTILSLLNRTWLYAFSPDCKYLWKHGPGEHQAYDMPNVTQSGIVILNDFHSITGFSLKGKQLWQVKGERTTNVMLLGEKVIYEPDDFSIVCLDAKTGKQLWTAAYPNHDPTYSYLHYIPTASGSLVFWEFQGGLEYLSDTGNVLWTFCETNIDENGIQFGLWDCGAAPTGNLCLSNNDQLISLSPSGDMRWRNTWPAGSLYDLVVKGSYIFVNSKTNPSEADIARYKKAVDSGRVDAPLPDTKEHLLCFDQQGNLVWDLTDLPTTLGPTYYENDTLIFREPSSRENDTQRLQIWQP